MIRLSKLANQKSPKEEIAFVSFFWGKLIERKENIEKTKKKEKKKKRDKKGGKAKQKEKSPTTNGDPIYKLNRRFPIGFASLV